MNIKEALQKLVESGNELYAKIAEVTAVDSEAKTCDVKPIDGTSEIVDVFLNLDETTGQFREPVIGALICVVFITKEMVRTRSIIINTLIIVLYFLLCFLIVTIYLSSLLILFRFEFFKHLLEGISS